jgi:HD-like signal output (HDOD) protein
MANLDSFFATIKLPSMSEVAHALIQTLNDEDAHVQQIRDIIAKDPALSAKLLRLANSAQFGLPRGVGTLDDAITMVGMAKVRTLALGACLSETFPDLPDLDRKEFWRSSMACAGYSQWLAVRLNIDGQLAWLTGMMLRLGELLIAQAEPVVLQEIEKLPHLPGVRWQREQRLIGFTEGQITAELARRWNFPMQMVQALQRSADPIATQAFSRLGAVLHLAGLLAEEPRSSADMVEELPNDVITILTLDKEWLRSHFPDEATFLDVSPH